MKNNTSSPNRPSNPRLRTPLASRIAHLFPLLSIVATTAFAQQQGDIPGTVTIPLQRAEAKGGGPRLAILISLGGGPKLPYILDTGSGGFFSAAPDSKWPAGSRTTITAAADLEPWLFSDGVRWSYDVVTTSIDIGLGFPIENVRMGRITDAWGGGLGAKGQSNWAERVEAGEAPFNWSYGNFGADLLASDGICNVLAQLPGNLSSGFIIRTGGPDADGGELVVGLTDEMRAEFPIKIPMNRFEGRSFPTSNLPSYRERLIDAHFQMRYEGRTAGFDAPTMLDTGAPATNLIAPDTSPVPETFVNEHHLREGVEFHVTAPSADGGTATVFNFPAGLRLGWNRVTVEKPAVRTPVVNAGIATFFRHDVMFDLQNGVVGLKPLYE